MSKESDTLKEIFLSIRKLTEEDLDSLRKYMAAIPSLTGQNADWVRVRMEVELIDDIRLLDKTSTRLINTANNLTKVMLGIGVVGVIATIAGVVHTIFF